MRKYFSVVTIFVTLFSLVLFSCRQNEAAKPAVEASPEGVVTTETDINNVANDYATIEQSLIAKATENATAKNDIDIDNAEFNPRDIFARLFWNINPSPHKWGEGFEVILDSLHEPNPGSLRQFLPERSYIVKNEIIEVHYYPVSWLHPAYRLSLFTGDFVPFTVILRKNTDEFFLGNYVDKHIGELFSDFDADWELNIIRTWTVMMPGFFNEPATDRILDAVSMAEPYNVTIYSTNLNHWQYIAVRTLDGIITKIGYTNEL